MNTYGSAGIGLGICAIFAGPMAALFHVFCPEKIGVVKAIILGLFK